MQNPRKTRKALRGEFQMLRRKRGSGCGVSFGCLGAFLEASGALEAHGIVHNAEPTKNPDQERTFP